VTTRIAYRHRILLLLQGGVRIRTQRAGEEASSVGQAGWLRKPWREGRCRGRIICPLSSLVERPGRRNDDAGTSLIVSRESAW
jgi:hypothetical protein